MLNHYTRSLYLYFRKNQPYQDQLVMNDIFQEINKNGVLPKYASSESSSFMRMCLGSQNFDPADCGDLIPFNVSGIQFKSQKSFDQDFKAKFLP
jgi:hypothetical protein